MALELVQGRLMLVRVLFAMGAEEATARRKCVVTQSVELVIAHDGEGGVALHHGADQMERLANLRTAINEVTYENGSTPRVAKCVALALVAKLVKEFLQGIGMAVNVADEIVIGVLHGHEEVTC